MVVRVLFVRVALFRIPPGLLARSAFSAELEPIQALSQPHAPPSRASQREAAEI